jgi:2,4-dienoyl-CoA reductase-like NADH-dependent reductase (Old Yellow Enzyme family)
MRGPIDYIIVGFEGNTFDGSILSAIAEAIDNGAIALVALSFIQKDAEGTVGIIDITNLGDAYAVEFAQKYKSDNTLVTQEDIDEVSELVENNTSVGLLIVEQLWAKPLKKALVDANGVLVAEGRIHPDAADELNEEGEE